MRSSRTIRRFVGAIAASAVSALLFGGVAAIAVDDIAGHGVKKRSSVMETAGHGVKRR